MVLFLLMFAGTGALAQNIEINATNFPDENFRNWLRQQTYGADGILTSSEISAVKKMHIEGQNIKSLEGINEFFNLQDLRCDNNQLTSLEIAGLSNLELLTCTNNMLTSLSILSARSLLIIECQNNQLTSFIIEGSCPELINIECYQNQLKASAMDNFLNSLPACKHSGQLMIIDTDNLYEEGNILSMRQRGLIKSGWDIRDSHGNSYHGGYTSEIVPIGSSGYTTWVTKIADTYETRYHNSDCIEFATVDGITAYIVTAATPAGVKLEPIEKAMPNTPVILNGPEGRHEFTESLTFGGAYDDNTKLKAKGAVGDGRTIYKLDSGSQGVGFYLVEAGEEVEHYLVIEQTAGSAPEFIPMGTDIEIPDEDDGDNNGGNGDDTTVTVCIDDLYYKCDTASKTATVVAVPRSLPDLPDPPSLNGGYSLSAVTIPDVVDYDGVTYSVTGIGSGAFRRCTSLTSVTIGKNVESIGDEAFFNSNLPTLISLATTPPSCGSHLFGLAVGSSGKKPTLYVPAANRAAYETASVWNSLTIKSELSVTIGSTGYATYCGMTDLDFTDVADGVKAYVASSYDDGSVTLMPVMNVPAGTGLLLIGAEGVYDVPFVVINNAYDDNLLVGTLEAQPLPKTADGCTNYVLGRKGTEVAFFLPKEGETIAAYKAYLRLPTDVPSGVRMVIDDGTTAVGLPARQEAGQQSESAVYTLTGQRVSTPRRGLYVVGGRKVIVK